METVKTTIQTIDIRHIKYADHNSLILIKLVHILGFPVYTVCSRSLAPFYIVYYTILYKMGRNFLDVQYGILNIISISNEGNNGYICKTGMK